MDVRAIPYPADFNVISTPGNFTGWTFSVELEPGVVYNTRIMRGDSPEAIADQLRKLAEKIEGHPE